MTSLAPLFRSYGVSAAHSLPTIASEAVVAYTEAYVRYIGPMIAIISLHNLLYVLTRRVVE